MTIVARDTLNMRIKAEDRSLIDWAAKAQGKTRTEFVMTAARRAAEEAMLDHALVEVNSEAYETFIARLDAPLPPSDRLKRTLHIKAPWE